MAGGLEPLLKETMFPPFAETSPHVASVEKLWGTDKLARFFFFFSEFFRTQKLNISFSFFLLPSLLDAGLTLRIGLSDTRSSLMFCEALALPSMQLLADFYC